MIFLKKIEVLGGSQLRFFCYNEFACKIINQIIIEKKNKTLNKVFNIGNFNTNIIKLTKTILKITKLKDVVETDQLLVDFLANFLTSQVCKMFSIGREHVLEVSKRFSKIRAFHRTNSPGHTTTQTFFMITNNTKTCFKSKIQ